MHDNFLDFISKPYQFYPQEHIADCLCWVESNISEDPRHLRRKQQSATEHNVAEDSAVIIKTETCLCEYNRIIKHILSHRQSLRMWCAGGFLALIYMTATNKLSLNFLIGLVWLIRPPCRVQMVTVTEWNQHPAKIWLGGFGPSKQIMVEGAGGTRNEWAESFVFPPYFLSIIHKQL